MNIETIRVKPWGEGQGDFVVIEKDQFDPEIHEEYLDPAEQAAKAAPKAARTTKKADAAAQ